MARNLERDAREEQRRRKQILEAGFKLFSEKGIENVSLQAVADLADVGIATLYNYYQNKVSLVVAISAYVWKEIMYESISEDSSVDMDSLSSYGKIEFYCDIIIKIYVERPEILRFSGDYKTFICRQDMPEKLAIEHLETLKPVHAIFYDSFEKAKTDKSIRTDIPAENMFTTISLTMLGMAERYAQGIIWTMKDSKDYLYELELTKRMMLDWLKG